MFRVQLLSRQLLPTLACVGSSFILNLYTCIYCTPSSRHCIPRVRCSPTFPESSSSRSGGSSGVSPVSTRVEENNNPDTEHYCGPSLTSCPRVGVTRRVTLQLHHHRTEDSIVAEMRHAAVVAKMGLERLLQRTKVLPGIWKERPAAVELTPCEV